MMKVKTLTAPTASALDKAIEKSMDKGWTPNGGHQAVTDKEQFVYAGKQLMQIRKTHIYSITMFKI